MRRYDSAGAYIIPGPRRLVGDQSSIRCVFVKPNAGNLLPRIVVYELGCIACLYVGCNRHAEDYLHRQVLLD